MPSVSEWKVPPEAQPKPEDYDYDLDAALAAVVAIRALVPADAFSAETLGSERLGNGVFIDPTVVLTIGYLITEAETIWITLADGRVVPGHALAYDQQTGFGLVQALAKLEAPALALGSSTKVDVGEHVVVAAGGGSSRSLAGRIVARQEFAGYWEYLLDDAIFTAPAHPHWGGTALIGPEGDLIGIGSLQLMASAGEEGRTLPINMMVPIDILKPILDDMKTLGRTNRAVRPWLGLYATEVGNRIVVAGLARRGPSEAADLRTGDIILGVGEKPVQGLAAFYREVWSLGDAGVEVPLTVNRDGRTLSVCVVSGDRADFLKRPSLH